MAKHIMAVFSNAKPGRDEEYMHWYENVHLADICSIPGAKGGHMFEVSPASPHKPATYFAIYELDVEDPQDFLNGMMERSASGEMARTDAVDAETSRIMFFKQKF